MATVGSLVLVLSKHPYGLQNGDTMVSRALLSAAAEIAPTRGIVLDSGPTPSGPIPVDVVPKAPLRLGRMMARSVLRGRSAIHERFAPPELVAALRAAPEEHVITRRLTMAEAALRAGRPPDAIIDVLESDIIPWHRPGWRRLPLVLEAARTASDERRCARQAASLAALDDEGTRFARAMGKPDAVRLDVSFPPRGGPRREATRPIALYLGDRTHPPNREGLEALYRLWPSIRAKAPNAELVVVGRPSHADPPAPAGARSLGFVPDLEAVWRDARVLLAPIPIGGGVRVKILEAACVGVPVVASPAAVGSIAHYLPVTPAPDDARFVEDAARLLRDAAAARRAGEGLWEANSAHTSRRALAGGLERWLARPGSAAHVRAS